MATELFGYPARKRNSEAVDNRNYIVRQTDRSIRHVRIVCTFQIPEDFAASGHLRVRWRWIDQRPDAFDQVPTGQTEVMKEPIS